MEPSSSSSAIEHQESMQDSCSDFVCERETMRAVERQRQEQILRQQDSRRDVDGYFDGSGGVVNHYDEFNRPKRYLKIIVIIVFSSRVKQYILTLGRQRVKNIQKFTSNIENDSY